MQIRFPNKHRWDILWSGVEDNGEWFLLPSIVLYLGRRGGDRKIAYVSFSLTFLRWRVGVFIYFLHTIFR